eukprot:TRINITY_DN15743_c0_g1_i1.p1 TRINITY_DN15743_c0_g1~~TRINITY_DN15743_c0_g1_i1.p1  ORF type:complete len:324 (+),score=61.76 TRINITY_DN15743_c0_g1_i1:39-974(+)
MKHLIDENDEVYYEDDVDSTDELFLHDEEQLQMITVPIERHQYSYHRSRPRKRTTGDVLDYLEYAASPQMIEDSVNRLYRPKQSTRSRNKAFLMKGYGHKASDRFDAANRSPSPPPRPMPLNEKDIEEARERLYGSQRRTASKLDEKRKKKEENETKPGRWKPDKKLTEAELEDLSGRLFPNSKRAKEKTLSYLCERMSKPLNASNFATYSHIMSLNTLRQVSPDDPIKKKVETEAPFGERRWTGSVQRTAARENSRTDRVAIAGIAVHKDPTLPPPCKLYDPPSNPYKATKSIEHKQRKRIYPSESPGWK